MEEIALKTDQFELVLKSWLSGQSDVHPGAYIPVWCPHCGTHVYTKFGAFICPFCQGKGSLLLDEFVGLRVVKS